MLYSISARNPMRYSTIEYLNKLHHGSFLGKDPLKVNKTNASKTVSEKTHFGITYTKYGIIHTSTAYGMYINLLV